ncbi:MAG TPA: sugar phosphate isomerase/epimerase [Planctomycetes bacterium]|nr:sugar phosphate isomerase/epimerase [Planctomycetota bacterium]
MFISGFVDEAGPDIATQIKVTKELGFSHVEMRMVDGKQFTQLDDAAFEKAWDELQEAGISISCYGSAIANWSRPVNGDFNLDIADLRRSAPRMRMTGTPFIRVMSWKQGDASEEEWGREAVRRMKELAKIAEDEGITLVHENCDGWGGHTIENTVALLEQVNSPALKLVFDTGNPAHHKQDAWEYYRRVRKDVVYVHIKDYKPAGEKMRACFAGEGVGRVEDIVTDLLSTGYDGGFSLEPHIAGAIHEGTVAGEKKSAYQIYVEYGRRFAQLLERAKKNAGRP